MTRQLHVTSVLGRDSQLSGDNLSSSRSSNLSAERRPVEPGVLLSVCRWRCLSGTVRPSTVVRPAGSGSPARPARPGGGTTVSGSTHADCGSLDGDEGPQQRWLPSSEWRVTTSHGRWSLLDHDRSTCTAAAAQINAASQHHALIVFTHTYR